MKTAISELKKGDVFKFNDETHIVKRKHLGDDKYGKERPLITLLGERFYHEGLEVEKINN